MGWPKEFSLVKEGLQGPGFVSDKPLRKLLKTGAGTKATNSKIIKQITDKYPNIQLPEEWPAEIEQMSLVQKKWIGFLLGFAQSELGKTSGVFNNTLLSLIQADIKWHIARRKVISSNPDKLLLTDVPKSSDSNLPLKASESNQATLAYITLLAAYEISLQYRLDIESSSSYLLDLMPMKDGESTIWPVKRLFDSWRDKFQFSIYEYASSLPVVTAEEPDPEGRALKNWQSGKYCPEEERILSQDTLKWIGDFIGVGELYAKEALIEWLRFQMACKFQRLFKAFEESDEVLLMFEEYQFYYSSLYQKFANSN